MKPRIILSLAAAALALSLNSCIHQLARTVVRPSHPTGKLPAVIVSNAQGKPAANKWLSMNSAELPPPSPASLNITYGEGNIPYGILSEYSNVVTSPYSPYHELDYSNCKVGQKVWDPYTRKPFYIPRSYTIN